MPIALRTALLALAGLIALAFGPAAATAPAPRPNIVVLLIDDGGYTDLGAYGSEIRTPNIDALAARGTKFANFHVSPMCAPTRAMLMTGVDSHLAGVGNLPESTPPEHRDEPGYQGRLARNVTTMASLLQASGYYTVMAGKWHLGHEAGDLPSDRGFTRSLTLDATGGDNWRQRPYFPIYDGSEWFEDGKRVKLPAEFYSSKLLVDRTIGYLDGRKPGQPFFAYLPFLAIHLPVQAPAEYTARYDGVYDAGWEVQRRRRYEGALKAGVIAPGTPMGLMPMNVKAWAALTPKEQERAAKNMQVNAGMLEAMDAEFGRLVDHLKKTGDYDNTLFVVLSDNGPEAADPTADRVFQTWMNSVGYRRDVETLGQKDSFAAIGPGWASASAAPGALFKFYASEGGIRVPLIVAGPGVAQGRTAKGFAYVTDVPATLLEAAGVAQAPAPTLPITGKSLRPVLTGQAESAYGPTDQIGMEAAGHGTLFEGDFKLVRNIAPLGDGQWRLFDIARDPGETQDLAKAEPERFARMKAAYEAYAIRVGAAPVPADYTADKQVTKAIGRQIIGRFGPWLLGGLAVVLAVIAFVAWRMVRSGETLAGIAARLTLGIVGVLALLIASRFWLDPAATGLAFFLDPVGVAGAGTLRADMAAFFAAAAGMTLAAAIRRESRWLWPVILLLALALAGRFLNLALEGPAPGVFAPMVVEAVLIAILLLTGRVLPKRRD